MQLTPRIKNKKKEVLTRLFRQCKEKDDLTFHNNLVRDISKDVGFGNPHDVTKLDDTSKLPEILLKEDYFIVHLGKGYHQFVQGIARGYHSFEPVANVRDWAYKKSILNETDTSESNVLSVASNQKIIHDFLYGGEQSSAKTYNSRRTKLSIDYRIGNHLIRTDKLQMEIDFTMEFDKNVTVFEAKNGFPKDFAVYQLFMPYRYYYSLKHDDNIPIGDINGCYLLREKDKKGASIVRAYLYTFDRYDDINSIRLLRATQYNLIQT